MLRACELRGSRATVTGPKTRSWSIVNRGMGCLDISIWKIRMMLLTRMHWKGGLHVTWRSWFKWYSSIADRQLQHSLAGRACPPWHVFATGFLLGTEYLSLCLQPCTHQQQRVKVKAKVEAGAGVEAGAHATVEKLVVQMMTAHTPSLLPMQMCLP